MIVKKIVTTNFITNCYLLQNEDAAVIIDPGDNDNRIIEFAKENVQKKDKAILLTHCHFDHILGVDTVRKAFDAPVIISKSEVKGLADANINMSRLLGGCPVSVSADKTVEDGDELNFGGETIEVIATPGHTVGGVCYKLNDMLFCGDTLFNLSVGRYDLPTANQAMLLESLQKIKNLQGDYTVYSGHGETTTLEFEIQNNYYLKG